MVIHPMSTESKKRKHNQVTVDQPHIKKLTDIEHALHAGDFYIGQTIHTESPKVERFVFDADKNAMIYRAIQYPHGLVKLFDEALVNAADNVQRGTTTIKVGINTLQNAIWVHNDGPNFPIVETQYASRVNPSKKAYQPEVAFFHPKSSSNYTKKQRTTGGKYGLGAKLIAIFSQWCTIEMCDGTTYYYQKSSDHMKQVHVPKVKPAAANAKPSLSICFCPDLSLFYPQGQAPVKLTQDIIDIFLTRVYDIAGTCRAKVFWSMTHDQFKAPKLVKGTRIPVKGFKDYIKLFLPVDMRQQIQEGEVKEPKIAYYANERWQVCLINNPYSFPVNVSFVNNINTYLGGQHVKYIQHQVYDFCKSKVEGIDLRRVINNTMIFVNALIEDPDFDSQVKTTLMTLPNLFGSICELPAKFLNVLGRNGIIDSLKQTMEQKAADQARRTIGAGKRKPVSDIPHFRDARYAGTRQSHKCSLYIVEGVSAFQLTEVGLSVLGTDYYGSFALKGKPINVEASIKKLSKNVEFVNICRVLGLELGKETPRSQLRYGKIICFTDQDLDGSHIQGLLLWLFRTHWPHLLKETNFVQVMITPIVVASRGIGSKDGATKGKTVNRFYTLQSFQQWWSSQSERKWAIKYYKGLATSTPKEGRYYFKNMKDHLRFFQPAESKDLDMLDVVFGKKNANARKQWLDLYNDSVYIPYDQIRQLSIDRFLNEDMKHYSRASMIRGIPMCEDGLTPAARKCLWVFLKKNIVKDIKLSNAKGVVDSETNYHHGPDSLYKTIVRMAQTFMGRQNINVFVPSGLFGSVSDGGKSYGADRYIYSRLVVPLTRYIFPVEDDAILTPQEDEGHTIEPLCLAPIIPMILVNGAQNIGTAYSCNIPCYKPEALIDAIRKRLVNHSYRLETGPWYDKFKGTIQGKANGSMTTTGSCQPTEKGWRITELPLGEWRDNYKVFLHKQIEKGLIEDFHENHRNEDICFEVKVSNEVKDPIKFFKLTSSQTGHLNLFTLSSSSTDIHSFPTIADIFEHWFLFRRSLYEKRRLHLLNQLQQQIPYLLIKTRFIELVLQQRLPLGRQKQVLHQTLMEHKIDQQYHDSLLAMSLNSFTEEKVKTIQNELTQCRQKILYFEQVSPDALWLQDLERLEKALPEFWASRVIVSDDDDE